MKHDKLGVWGLIRCSGQTLRTEYIPKPEVFLRNSRFWDKNSNFWGLRIPPLAVINLAGCHKISWGFPPPPPPHRHTCPSSLITFNKYSLLHNILWGERIGLSKNFGFLFNPAFRRYFSGQTVKIAVRMNQTWIFSIRTPGFSCKLKVSEVRTKDLY